MKKIVSYNAGWVKPKSHIDLAENFYKIFMFYVINTPCGDLSSSAKDIKKYYQWPKNVWSNRRLIKALYSCANLDKDKENPNLEVCTEIDNMCEKLVKVKLNGKFPPANHLEKICIYKPKKYSEFIAICYHIRNAIAYGRFTVYELSSNERIYAMEDGVHSGKDDFEIRSRLILKERTLLQWKDIIESGPTGLDSVEEDDKIELEKKVIEEIANSHRVTVKTLMQKLHKKKREIKYIIKALKEQSIIRFDNSKRSWVSI